MKKNKNSSTSNTASDERAIEHLKQAVADGEHWYIILLETIKLWKNAEETYNERHYRYLIDDEAFDWLLLAERLCEEIKDFIPEKELIDLLFFDKPPIEMPTDKFKKSIGAAKYRAYLNYLYGVMVEEALIAAVVDDIRKERRASGLNKHEDELDKAYLRIYNANQQDILDIFRNERKYPKNKSITLTELKEFYYWLFKYRVKICDSSRVASDTKKALMQMQRNVPQAKRIV